MSKNKGTPTKEKEPVDHERRQMIAIMAVFDPATTRIIGQAMHTYAAIVGANGFGYIESGDTEFTAEEIEAISARFYGANAGRSFIPDGVDIDVIMDGESV